MVGLPEVDWQLEGALLLLNKAACLWMVVFLLARY